MAIVKIESTVIIVLQILNAIILHLLIDLVHIYHVLTLGCHNSISIDFSRTVPNGPPPFHLSPTDILLIYHNIAMLVFHNIDKFIIYYFYVVTTCILTLPEHHLIFFLNTAMKYYEAFIRISITPLSSIFHLTTACVAY